jgi:hypothetical protein
MARIVRRVVEHRGPGEADAEQHEDAEDDRDNRRERALRNGRKAWLAGRALEHCDLLAEKAAPGAGF